MNITLSVNINFDSWFSEGKEPKTKEEWRAFFEKHFLPESEVLGIENGDDAELISVINCTIEVRQIKR